MVSPQSLATARIRAICMALPEATEKLAWGRPTWRVGSGAMFAQPSSDGTLGLPCDLPAQAALVEADPAQFFVPPYTGVKGWVGVRIGDSTDWEQVAALIVEGYRRVAPRRLLPLLDDPALAPAVLGRAASAAVADAAEVAEEVRLAEAGAAAAVRLRGLCLQWPGVTEQPAGPHIGFQVAGKTFTWLQVDHHGDGIVSVVCKGEPGLQDVLVHTDSNRFFVPAYMGTHGWVGARVDIEFVDWDEIGALVLGSYRLVAPKRVLKEFDAGAAS